MGTRTEAAREQIHIGTEPVRSSSGTDNERWRRQLHLITSGSQSLYEVLAIVSAAARGGLDFLHIREKTRTAREISEWVRAIGEIFPLERIFLNDRVDVAAAWGVRGSHLAYHSLAVPLARRVLSDSQLAGRSVHSMAEAEAAVAEGADYLIYGHLFVSNSKPGLSPRGTEELARITAQVSVPVIAIGGIRPDNVDMALAAGCAGIAVLSGITHAPDPEAATRAYREALDKGGTA
ncbi:thiamine phosphate synthase [Brevibacillus dissolubilis]|uniref:thiamine phosphate synthase n=1 Tax=Brevibacillus dissolubilis TaxID=1844116 RepID=UPI001116D24B|nr:thiamine phosphate synthase [Brevibacillus dissolubilis]